MRQGTGPYNWKKLTRTDWLISGIMIITLICLIYRICTGIADVNQEIVLLAIGVMYFVLHKYEVDIRAVFGVLCISNYIVYAMMLLSYITKGWSSPLIKFLKGNGGATAWLLLGVAVTVLSYCTSRRRKTNRLLWDRNAFGFISFIYGKKYDGDSDNRRAYNQSAIYI